MAQKYSLKPKASVSEGDVNLSPQRAAWSAAHIDASTHDLLAQDARAALAAPREHLAAAEHARVVPRLPGHLVDLGVRVAAGAVVDL